MAPGDARIDFGVVPDGSVSVRDRNPRAEDVIRPT
jgi:hypothetical protein